MATKKRERSESGFYHVFHRGVSQFDIFEDDADREFYLERMVRYCRELDVEIHAWCLMSNHTHLLVRADMDALSATMRKLGSAYAKRFNWRHMRSGPLFEGRFSSVCVETDEQYVTVMRYIHRNPIHHEEETLCGSYRWSSYGEHVAASPETCVVEFALGLFGSVDAFTRMHQDRVEDRERLLDVGTFGRMRDEEARWRANRALAEAGFEVPVSRIGTLPRKLRDDALACVKDAVKCSLRQLQRLTAVAYSAIRCATARLGREPVDAAGRERYERPMEELIAAFGNTALVCASDGAGGVAACRDSGPMGARPLLPASG